MLEIYKASAGAGKTHLLVRYYLDWILFGGTRFNEILAVTFTNKATAEMKTRIVAELYGLATAPEESDYWRDLCEQHPQETKSPTDVALRAKKALSEILGDYSAFQVSTIDKFFQSIVRAFTRELRLQGNYDIELGDDRILDQAVSALLTDIDPQADAEAYAWLQEFSRACIENGENWNLSGQLKKASRQITKENYQKYADEIYKFTHAAQDGLKDYAKRMSGIVQAWESEVRAAGQDALEAIHGDGLNLREDFSGKSRNPMVTFERIANGNFTVPSDTFYKWAEETDKWYAAKATRHLSDSATDSVRTAFRRVTNHYEGITYRNYLTAKAIRKNLYQMGLLADIDQKKRDLCDEQGIMLLSSTAELLNRLIGTSDAPFIYEKTGTKIQSYMIDEFQDTSQLQWSNFKPLLENSLASDGANLIVGDVKQSIYRWRGSEWALLDNGIHLQPSREDTETLRTNWRSQREIVAWNNAFFEKIKPADPEMAEEVKRIYKDVRQEVAPPHTDDYPGLIHVEAAENVMERLPDVVGEVLAQGYQPRDIAILTRTNDEGTEAAEALIDADIDIISDEALTLISRPVIQTLIALMRHMQNPRTAILEAIADYKLESMCGKSLYDDKPDENFHTTADRIHALSNRPLYELVEGLIAEMNVQNEGDAAFLQAFRDTVLEFAMSKSADLATFLTWWDDHGKTKAIATNKEQNAVRLLTIHKSKGLGVPVVIIPNASWAMDIKASGLKSDVLWCQPKVEPFALENIALPISLSSKLEGTIFEEDYKEERRRVIIDNLNTTYVAFTRAKEQLWLLYPQEPKKSNVHCLWSDLHDFVTDPENEVSAISEGVWEKGQRKQPTGKPSAATAEAQSPSRTITPSATEERSQLKAPILLRSVIIKEKEAILRGNCIHEALSTVTDRNSVKDAVHHFYRTTSDEYRALFAEEELLAHVERYLSQPEAEAWFSPEMRVINEQTILLPGNDEHRRPDRVMITPDGTAIVVDYKTGKPEKKHRIQVLAYRKRLQEMGFKRTKAYLWYLETNEVVTVWG